MSNTLPPLSPLNNNQQSAELQLQDIHLPASPDFWPPAPGWWLLATLILLFSGWLLFKYLTYKRRKKQQMAILATLHPIEKKLLDKGSNQAIADLNIVLRQLALMHFPPDQVASLTGSQWLAFLDQSGETSHFTQGVGKILAEAPYLPDNDTQNTNNSRHSSKQLKFTKNERMALIKLVRNWVKKIAVSQ